MQKAILFSLQIGMPAANSYSAFQLHFRISNLSKTVGKWAKDTYTESYAFPYFKPKQNCRQISVEYTESLCIFVCSKAGNPT